MNNFRNALERGGLSNLSWKGDKFTWSNRHGDDTFTKERLDRMVANKAWIETQKEVRVEVLVARSSDHRPVLLSFSHTNNLDFKGSRPFKYKAWWAFEIDCERVVKEGWKQSSRGREPFEKLKGSIRSCTEGLRRWSRALTRNKTHEIVAKTKLLKNLQKEEGSHNIQEIREVQKELDSLLDQEDLKWKQRAKRNWYKHGDRNTKFFHVCDN
ncbi:uncharacterized protein LOC121249294 [Juglans microcarpa x Juglans regia]|uniref:uncharacterized protein LOC121249294 n=1 Tax=Juglans microcarpa x Juglans regia TaxID=2249226 RepID=UPI001B7E98FE|nr:uncharacterized protein LOC121249294 [Juglans microcarpa x Juglans regia]